MKSRLERTGILISQIGESLKEADEFLVDN